MTLTIIILIAAIMLYVMGFKVFKQEGKKATMMDFIMHKGINVVAIVAIAACVCRLFTPVYLTKTNPSILQEMVASMQAQQEEAPMWHSG